jgi:hypothetical protein
LLFILLTVSWVFQPYFNDASLKLGMCLINPEKYSHNLGSEQILKSQSGKAGILHMAAHGSLNPHTPLFSRLWLSPENLEDGRLNVYEIYSLDLRNTSLVVLSACQTQLGEISAGDEIVSPPPYPLGGTR